LSPPVGLNVYAVHGVAPEIPMEEIFKGVIPFIFVSIAVVILLIIFPQIVTFVPNIMLKAP
jgi:TRAP-type mannitol/chloroaromatic compound transport system permease large subunit